MSSSASPNESERPIEPDSLIPPMPQAWYELERSLLEDHRIIPLVYLRETYGIAPRVHFQLRPSDPFALHLEDAWVEK